MFSVRLVTADSYQAQPLPQLDPTFSVFRGTEIKNVPVIRVFGTTPTGEKTCLHVHGVFPYLYVPYTGEENEDRLAYRLAASLDAAINISLGSANSTTQHVYQIQRVAGIPFYGYHKREHQFFKISFYNPAIMKKAADLLQTGAVLGQSLQPHEAHLNYTLQFMMDYNLYGMSFINLSSVKHRRGNEPSGDVITSYDSVITPVDNVEYLPVNVLRQSICELEIDAIASDILNREDLAKGIELNPGLSAIWNEERERRRQVGLGGGDSQIVNPKSPQRPPFRPTDSDLYQEQRLARRLLMISQCDESTLSMSTNPTPYPAEVTQGDVILNASNFGSLSVPTSDKTQRPNETLSLSSLGSTQSSQTSHECSVLDSDDLPLVELLENLARDSDTKDSVDEDSMLGTQLSSLNPDEEKSDDDSCTNEDLNLTCLELDSWSSWEGARKPSTLNSPHKSSLTDDDMDSTLLGALLAAGIDSDASPKTLESSVPQLDGAGDFCSSLLDSEEEENMQMEMENTSQLAKTSSACNQSTTNSSLSPSTSSSSSEGTSQSSWSLKYTPIDYEHLPDDFVDDIENIMQENILMEMNFTSGEEILAGGGLVDDEIPIERVLNGDPCFTETAELDKSDLTELHDQYVSLLDRQLLPEIYENSQNLDLINNSGSEEADNCQVGNEASGFSPNESVTHNSQEPVVEHCKQNSGIDVNAVDDKSEQVNRHISDSSDYNCNVATWEELHDYLPKGIIKRKCTQKVNNQVVERRKIKAAKCEVSGSNDVCEPPGETVEGNTSGSSIIQVNQVRENIMDVRVFPGVQYSSYLLGENETLVTPILADFEELTEPLSPPNDTDTTSDYCSDRSHRGVIFGEDQHRHCVYSFNHRKFVQDYVFTSNEIWVIEKRKRGKAGSAITSELCNRECRLPYVPLEKINIEEGSCSQEDQNIEAVENVILNSISSTLDNSPKEPDYGTTGALSIDLERDTKEERNTFTRITRQSERNFVQSQSSTESGDGPVIIRRVFEEKTSGSTCVKKRKIILKVGSNTDSQSDDSRVEDRSKVPLKTRRKVRRAKTKVPESHSNVENSPLLFDEKNPSIPVATLQCIKEAFTESEPTEAASRPRIMCSIKTKRIGMKWLLSMTSKYPSKISNQVVQSKLSAPQPQIRKMETITQRYKLRVRRGEHEGRSIVPTVKDEKVEGTSSLVTPAVELNNSPKLAGGIQGEDVAMVPENDAISSSSGDKNSQSEDDTTPVYTNTVAEVNLYSGKDYTIDAVSQEMPQVLFAEDSNPSFNESTMNMMSLKRSVDEIEAIPTADQSDNSSVKSFEGDEYSDHESGILSMVDDSGSNGTVNNDVAGDSGNSPSSFRALFINELQKSKRCERCERCDCNSYMNMLTKSGDTPRTGALRSEKIYLQEEKMSLVTKSIYRLIGDDADVNTNAGREIARVENHFDSEDDTLKDVSDKNLDSDYTGEERLSSTPKSSPKKISILRRIYSSNSESLHNDEASDCEGKIGERMETVVGNSGILGDEKMRNIGAGASDTDSAELDSNLSVVDEYKTLAEGDAVDAGILSEGVGGEEKWLKSGSQGQRESYLEVVLEEDNNVELVMGDGDEGNSEKTLSCTETRARARFNGECGGDSKTTSTAVLLADYNYKSGEGTNGDIVGDAAEGSSLGIKSGGFSDDEEIVPNSVSIEDDRYKQRLAISQRKILEEMPERNRAIVAIRSSELIDIDENTRDTFILDTGNDGIETCLQSCVRSAEELSIADTIIMEPSPDNSRDNNDKPLLDDGSMVDERSCVMEDKQLSEDAITGDFNGSGNSVSGVDKNSTDAKSIDENGEEVGVENGGIGSDEITVVEENAGSGNFSGKNTGSDGEFSELRCETVDYIEEIVIIEEIGECGRMTRDDDDLAEGHSTGVIGGEEEGQREKVVVDDNDASEVFPDIERAGEVSLEVNDRRENHSIDDKSPEDRPTLEENAEVFEEPQEPQRGAKMANDDDDDDDDDFCEVLPTPEEQLNENTSTVVIEVVGDVTPIAAPEVHSTTEAPATEDSPSPQRITEETRQVSDSLDDSEEIEFLSSPEPSEDETINVIINNLDHDEEVEEVSSSASNEIIPVPECQSLNDVTVSTNPPEPTEDVIPLINRIKHSPETLTNQFITLPPDLPTTEVPVSPTKCPRLFVKLERLNPDLVTKYLKSNSKRSNEETVKMRIQKRVTFSPVTSYFGSNETKPLKNSSEDGQTTNSEITSNTDGSASQNSSNEAPLKLTRSRADTKYPGKCPLAPSARKTPKGLEEDEPKSHKRLKLSDEPQESHEPNESQTSELSEDVPEIVYDSTSAVDSEKNKQLNLVQRILQETLLEEKLPEESNVEVEIFEDPPVAPEIHRSIPEKIPEPTPEAESSVSPPASHIPRLEFTRLSKMPSKRPRSPLSSSPSAVSIVSSQSLESSILNDFHPTHADRYVNTYVIQSAYRTKYHTVSVDKRLALTQITTKDSKLRVRTSKERFLVQLGLYPLNPDLEENWVKEKSHVSYIQRQQPKVLLHRLNAPTLKRYGYNHRFKSNRFGKRFLNTSDFKIPAYDGPADLTSSESDTSDNEGDITVGDREKRVCTYRSVRNKEILATPKKRKHPDTSGDGSPVAAKCLRSTPKRTPSRPSMLKSPGRLSGNYTPLKIIVTSPKVRREAPDTTELLKIDADGAANSSGYCVTPRRGEHRLHENLLRGRISQATPIQRSGSDRKLELTSIEKSSRDDTSGIVRRARENNSVETERETLSDIGEDVSKEMNVRKNLFTVYESTQLHDMNFSPKPSTSGNVEIHGEDIVRGDEEERETTERENLLFDEEEDDFRLKYSTLDETMLGGNEGERAMQTEYEVEDNLWNMTFTQYICSQQVKTTGSSSERSCSQALGDARKSIKIIPRYNAPSVERVRGTMATYGIPTCRNPQAFFSKQADAPGQKELAHRVLKVPGKGLVDVAPFKSSMEGITGLNRWRRMKINEFHPSKGKIQASSIRQSLAGHRSIVITPLLPPPSLKIVKTWIKARGYLKRQRDEERRRREEEKNQQTEQINKELETNTESQNKNKPVNAAESDENTSDSSDSSIVGPSPEKIIHSNSLRLLGRTPRNSQVERTLLTSTSRTCRLMASMEEEPSMDSEKSSSKSLNPSVMSMLEKSKLFKTQTSKHPGISCGQIECVSDSTRSDVENENMQNAKAVTTYQYITLMCVEVHVTTRGDLLPDPDHDPVSAIFYAIQCDVPPESPMKSLAHGVIAVAPEGSTKMGYTYGTEVPLDITLVPDESSLFEAFVKLVIERDPEVFIGWELEALSWGYIFQRATTFGVNLNKRISRIPGIQCKWETTTPDLDALGEIKLPGRVVLDIWRIMRHEMALLNYSFENVMYHVMNERISCPGFRTLTEWWNRDDFSGRWRVVEHYGVRVLGVLRILEQLDIIGRTSEHARLFGIQFYEVFTRGSQFRVESIMLRLAKPLNYIPVSPSPQQRAAMRAMEALPLIMEPESIFYSDPVIVLDFQSLYPSIIIAHNYCFSTCLGRIERIGQQCPFEFGASVLRVTKNTALKLQGKVNFAPCGVAFVKPEVRVGILSRMLTEILETRFMVKKAMKDHDKNDKTLQRVLHSRQLGLKFLANVTYGYTAANFTGRMPCMEVGDSVVSKAKETLERAIKLVESTTKWGARVVYGDTDSLFILAPGKSKDEAFKIGYEMAEAVTADNPSPIKLKFEKVLFPTILQTKKRYCGYMYESPDQEKPTFLAKGIETVRRDGCPAVSKILEKSLKILFDTKDVSQVKQYVVRQLDKVLRGKVSLQDLTFAKEFRGLRGYRERACVPALELTRRLMKKDPRALPRHNERVKYVIVAGAPNQALIHCVRSPWEVLNDPGLRPNAVYYITRVIIPPLNRCLNLMGVDVNTWYREMPHRHILDNPIAVPSDKQKQTIFQYFGNIVCAACGQTSNKALCSDCQSRPSDTLVMLNEKLRWLERVCEQVTSICQSCTGRGDTPECVSLDCPVLYRRAQAQRELTQGAQLEKIIKDQHIDF
ncbi:uncharacterized protein LOC107041289 [Diachasma alloeum]|uniref:uncharacterized protein LOC107041289 n=1 Tax=Diachasma alloeum TaxID=454923 RepID=UPI00073848E3|nr:uncharacterized protein LOC107041289 [Diachasma alloeum]